MSRTLCLYPAEQVYTPAYRSASEAIAARRLALTRPAGRDDLADELLDPDDPLVVGILERVRAAAENRAEAALVARAAVRLRERLRSGPRRRYPDTREGDAGFWEHGLFVVSPHHLQINAIRRALRAARAWHVPPFVDTVDRMQGQECEAVLVSYGVADVEQALSEREFIPSLNRLNVSIARARAKTVVFLPRPLVEPPLQVYEDGRIADGVAFMQGLVRFAERRGESKRYAQPEGANSGSCACGRPDTSPPERVPWPDALHGTAPPRPRVRRDRGHGPQDERVAIERNSPTHGNPGGCGVRAAGRSRCPVRM